MLISPPKSKDVLLTKPMAGLCESALDPRGDDATLSGAESGFCFDTNDRWLAALREDELASPFAPGSGL